MNEDEKKDNQGQEVNNLEEGYKKGNKSKFRMLARIFVFVISHFAIIFSTISIVSIIVLALDYILDEDGDNKIAEIASDISMNRDVSIVADTQGRRILF